MSASITLDSYPVLIGDRVVDVAFGAGVVVSVSSSQFAVSFPNATSQIYSSLGQSTTFSRRTLYWADPVDVVGPPPKPAALRLQLKAVVAPLATLIAGLAG